MVKMDISENIFQTQIPNIWHINLVWATSMTLKITVPKMYEFIFKLENVVETLGDCRKPVTLVEITFFRVIFCWNRRKGQVIFSNMGDMCNIWKKYGRIFATHPMTGSSLQSGRTSWWLIMGWLRAMANSFWQSWYSRTSHSSRHIWNRIKDQEDDKSVGHFV